MNTRLDKNVIDIVGIGPGDRRFLSHEAEEVIEDCDVVVGYTVYVDLLKASFPDKEYRNQRLLPPSVPQHQGLLPVVDGAHELCAAILFVNIMYTHNYC